MSDKVRRALSSYYRQSLIKLMHSVDTSTSDGIRNFPIYIYDSNSYMFQPLNGVEPVKSSKQIIPRDQISA